MPRSQEPQETGEKQVPTEPVESVETAEAAETADAAETASTTEPEDDLAEDVNLPWGYGIDRVGAMAVDPERLFVYWELTDDAIERARKRAGDAQAPVVLRVYEITGRIFDGTNAHGHFDHEIDRADRQWFFDIQRPGSEFVVELGLRLDEDRFVKIARSARVEFPRSESSAPSSPRWLTVRVREGRPEPVPEPMNPSPGIRHNWPEPPSPSAVEVRPVEHPPAAPQAPGRWAHDHPSAAAESEPQELRVESPQPVELQTEQRRVVRWEKPTVWNSWESGSSTTELDAPAPWTESYSGETRFYRDGPQTRVVTGPWDVVIRGLGSYKRREVLAHWEIHRSWVTDEGSEIQREMPGDSERKPGSSERVQSGSSERRWRVGSELRLSGSSELLYSGASERRLGGASERQFRGASERRLGGASERRLGGASERIPRGASERRLGGASERLRPGASERRLDSARNRRKPADARAYPRVEGRLDDE